MVRPQLKDNNVIWANPGQLFRDRLITLHIRQRFDPKRDLRPQKREVMAGVNDRC
jgi:hypothetical protein